MTDSYLSVEIEATEKGCVEDENSTEKFLVEPKVTHFDLRAEGSPATCSRASELQLKAEECWASGRDG